MKKALLFTFTATLILFSSCNKDLDTNATVVRDCTGTYLQMDGDDFYVCNSGELAQFDNGTKLQVSYKPVPECTFTGTICLLYHPKKGDIEVTDVK